MATIQLAPADCAAIKDWTILASDGVQKSHTGDVVEFTFATITLPGGSLGPNGVLRISSIWTANNTAGNKTLRHRLAGTAIAQLPLASPNIFYSTLTLVRNRNAQNSQVFWNITLAGGIGSTTGAIATSAIDLSVNQNITLTGLLANAGDTIALEAYFIEVLYGA